MATLDFNPPLRSSIGFDQFQGLPSYALQREETGRLHCTIAKVNGNRHRIECDQPEELDPRSLPASAGVMLPWGAGARPRRTLRPREALGLAPAASVAFRDPIAPLTDRAGSLA